MSASLTISRAGLTDFLTCQRRFQLRYQQRLPWPQEPLTAVVKKRLALGDRFHQMVERHYLRLPIPADWLEASGENDLRRWWDAFLQNPPVRQANAHRLLPEATITVPVGNHALIGRFDLLVLTTANEVHLYDWKTGRPRSVGDLRDDWQTRLYLALAVAGGAALGLPTLAPEQVKLTYWYAREPSQPRTIGYDTAVHEQNWGELIQLVDDIDQRLGQAEWPLTDDLEACASCRYAAYCGRFDTPEIIDDILEERAFWEDASWLSEPLEPEIE
jgi:CRISPR/Cas system-associated exonuclease Cas4 (RecB family)